MAQPSEQLEQRYQVRQVTQYQFSWTEQERGSSGAFTVQLILDHGADEYILRPTSSDADLLLKLLDRAPAAFFDTERKVLMFGNLAVK
jgi:hypothetical protein